MSSLSDIVQAIIIEHRKSASAKISTARSQGLIFNSFLELCMSEFPGVKFVQDADGRCYVDSVSEENLIGSRLSPFPESYHCPVCDGYVKGQPLSEVSYGADRIQGDKTLNIEFLLCSICGYELNCFASHT